MRKYLSYLMIPFILSSCVSKSPQKESIQNSPDRHFSEQDSQTPQLDAAISQWKNDGYHHKSILEDIAQSKNSTLNSSVITESIEKRLSLWIQKLKSKNETEITQLKSEIKNYFSHMTTYFEIIASMVHDFDAKIEKQITSKSSNNEIDLSTDQDYQLILLSRELHEHYENEIKYLYAKGLRAIYNKFTDFDEMNELINIIREYLKDQINSSDSHGIFSFLSSLEEVNTLIIEDLQNSTLISEIKKTYTIPINDMLINLKEKIENNQNYFKSKTNEFKKSKGEFIQKLKEIKSKGAHKIEGALNGLKRNTLEVIDSIRTPNSTEKISFFTPSRGENGTMSGRSFSSGEWAITLDDGPSIYTQKFLNLLNLAKNERFTFFWLSKLMYKYPDLVKKASENYRCERASHSMTHADLSRLNEKGLNYEINEALSKFEEVTNSPSTMFRCPYGACGKKGRIRLEEKGLIHIFWNVDSLDWQDKNPKSIIKRVKNQMATNKRGIILFHDIHFRSIEATKEILNYIRTETSMKLVTVGDKLKDNYLTQGKEFKTP